MKIHEVEQGTEEWLALRCGIPTASEFRNLVTPKWKVRTGAGVDTYLARKLAERWRGSPLTSWSGGSMEQGSLLEGEAVPYFEIETGQSVERVGFVTTDDGRWGCSPDGLLSGGGGGIEIKCPEPHTQVKYLLAGVCPEEYVAQVQGSMLVTESATWTFFSYCRGFPDLILVIERDEDAMEALADALEEFSERLDNGYGMLMDLFGRQPNTSDFDESGSLGL